MNNIINKYNDISSLLQDTSLNNIDIELSEKLSDDELAKSLSSIEEYEYTNKSVINIITKNLSVKQKELILKTYIKEERYINSSIVLNIINLIKIYNDLSDEFFNHRLIMFKDIPELLTVKIDLKTELQDFSSMLIKWYLSVLKSLHKFDANELENIVEIPNIFKKILTCLDYITLSGIFSKSTNICIDDLPFVKNAYLIFSTYQEKFYMQMQLFDKVYNNIIKKD